MRTTAFAGYLGPSAFGVGAAKLIQLGYIEVVPWLALTLLAVLLVSVRNPFGIIVVLLTGGFFFLVARDGAAGLQTMAAYTLTWFLLLSGLRVVLSHRTGAGDAENLRKMTHLPKMLWFVLWLAGTAAALGFGGSLLI